MDGWFNGWLTGWLAGWMDDERNEMIIYIYIDDGL